jgi:hypothetical protein
MLWLSIEHSIIGFYNPTQTILYIGQLKIIFSFSSDFLKNGGRAGGF